MNYPKAILLSLALLAMHSLNVKETCQFLITKSVDDGLTWSDPVNITAQTKKPEWWLYAYYETF